MSEVHTSKARLSVYIDYKSPAAYLAVDPTYALEDEFGLEIDWKPLILERPIRRERKSVAEETKAERHARVRAEYVQMDQQRYAQAQGLSLKYPSRDWDSTLAAIGLIWAKEQSGLYSRVYTSPIEVRET